MNDMSLWYATLQKPWFAPEPWVFGLAWGIIYPLIAIAFFWIGYLVYRGALPKMVLLPLFINLLFNLSFTYIQFGLMNNFLAAIWISIVVGSLIWLMYMTLSILLINALLVPYLLWGLFATVLQFSITYLNR